MKWKEMKGKCQICERVRHKGKSALRYRSFEDGSAQVECTVCKSLWSTEGVGDARMQVARQEEISNGT